MFTLESILIFALFLGLSLSIGSFVGMASYRIPRKINLGKTGYPYLLGGRSQCPQCNRDLRNRDLVPILSHLLLRGKCFFCNKKISSRYLFIELAACACFLTCILASNDNLVRITLFCFLVGLLLSSTIDIEHGLLPDQITLPLLWLGLIVNLYLELVPLSAAVLGATLGYVSLWLLFWIYKFLRGKEAFGYGDFKLLAATGAWFGFQAIPSTLLYASITGLIWALLKGFIEKSPIQSLPFGPFISFGVIIYILSSNSL
tara:strand:- start:432 stop:1208 length:777 start_codon:yes stop_codon:yes gene_type:complete